MGSSNMQYRRRVVACGASSNWVEDVILFDQGIVNSAGSIQLGNSNNSSIPSGFSPGAVSYTHLTLPTKA